MKLFEVSIQLHINEVRANCFVFIVDHLSEVNRDDLCALPVELLLEVIQHPAAVMDPDDAAESEKQMFYLIWNKMESTPEETKMEYVPKILKAIHLPVTDSIFLFFLLKLFAHIPEARELIIEADKKVDLPETREWYLERRDDGVWMMTNTQVKPMKINEIRTKEYSRCVLIKGFPFYIYMTSSCNDEFEQEYHVESPWAIEHLGLPYKVVVEIEKENESEVIPVNTYHNGVVHKRPFDESFQDEDQEFYIRVTLQ